MKHYGKNRRLFNEKVEAFAIDVDLVEEEPPEKEMKEVE